MGDITACAAVAAVGLQPGPAGSSRGVSTSERDASGCSMRGLTGEGLERRAVLSWGPRGGKFNCRWWRGATVGVLCTCMEREPSADAARDALRVSASSRIVDGRDMKVVVRERTEDSMRDSGELMRTAAGGLVAVGGAAAGSEAEEAITGAAEGLWRIWVAGGGRKSSIELACTQFFIIHCHFIHHHCRGGLSCVREHARRLHCCRQLVAK
jgi:hypothetical protein